MRSALYQKSMSHVAGMGPPQLAKFIEEEAKVHTEKPFEYDDDDEARFRWAKIMNAGCDEC